jgi:hypothetical protein
MRRIEALFSCVPLASRLFSCCLALTVLVGAGCAHSDRAEGVSSLRPLLTAEPPLFLKGPCALLLTNTESYTAHVVLERGAATDKALSGQLLVRGFKLFFAAESAASVSKKLKAGEISYIWDVSQGSGFVLSDALQGYAPIISGIKYTNLSLVNPTAAAVAGSDGSLATFQVWHSSGSTGLPVRIVSASGGPEFILNLTKPQTVATAPGLFDPPAGFTKYDSSESMMSELVVRQQNVRHRSQSGEAVPPGMEGEHRTRAGAPY